MSNEYPIKTTADEFSRLAIQADLFREDARAMCARIGDGRGLTVLDMCCGTGGITDVLSAWVGGEGTVVGADFDAAKLEFAKTWAKDAGLRNVAFARVNAFASGLAPRSFDMVHARFALSVIQNGLGILEQMLTLVKPRGVVCVQEVDASSMGCRPSTPAWKQAVRLCEDTFRAVGANVHLGASLTRVFEQHGLQEVQVTPCVHAQTCADPMTMHVPLTLAAMRDAITSNGLLDAQSLDALVEQVSAHVSLPDTTTTTFTMMQVVGRAPA